MFNIVRSTSLVKEHRFLERDCVIHVLQGCMVISSDGVFYTLDEKNVCLLTRGTIFSKTNVCNNLKYEILEFDRWEVEKDICKNLVQGPRFVTTKGTLITENLKRLYEKGNVLKDYLTKSLITQIVEEIYCQSRTKVEFLKEDNLLHNLVIYEKDNRFLKKYENPNLPELTQEEIKNKLLMPEGKYQTKMKCIYVQQMQENGLCVKDACKEMRLGYSSFYRHILKLISETQSDEKLEEGI